ncbi:hypothetical protein EDC56_1427 [Sinobacterium caligoides]|uniref:Uncharacterized protein n=1 Tax=Sinobacterium caligoides TaxID=933926 RepID=A0A3N2DMH9_9GAMM|nr:hypothetical protein [Sinobacterium caligoides]ROS01004.1 hypothetical protein EDC56_1427 [Sinobacterium caligoides]
MRTPPSRTIIALSLPLLFMISTGYFISQNTGNPDHQSLKALQRGELLTQQKRYPGAIKQLTLAATSTSQYAEQSHQRLRQLASIEHLQQLSIKEFTALSRSLIEYADKQPSSTFSLLQLWKYGGSTELSIEQRLILSQLIDSQQQLGASKSISSTRVSERYTDIYEQRLTLNANDHIAAQKLVTLYYQQRKMSQMIDLLQQHRNHLGSSEAAGILGQLYLNADNKGAAYQYLAAYSQPRLVRLEKAKKQLSTPPSPQQLKRYHDALSITPVAEKLARLLVTLANTGQPQQRQQRLDQADKILAIIHQEDDISESNTTDAS